MGILQGMEEVRGEEEESDGSFWTILETIQSDVEFKTGSWRSM